MQTYKAIYNNVIEKEEQIIEKVKTMIKANMFIKNNYREEEKEYTDTIKKRLKMQRNKLERIQNDKFTKYRKIL